MKRHFESQSASSQDDSDVGLEPQPKRHRTARYESQAAWALSFFKQNKDGKYVCQCTTTKVCEVQFTQKTSKANFVQHLINVHKLEVIFNPEYFKIKTQGP
jgi:hypothetical protein